MTSFDGDYGITVVKLAGPGVPGLEADTPLYHFDVPAERMAEFVRDPDAFAARLGLRPPRDREYAHVNLRVIPASADSAFEAAAGDEPTVLGVEAAPHACCYLSGEDEITCHMHDHDEPIA
jgi:hypothetical protein